jgi:hypothetical protein
MHVLGKILVLLAILLTSIVGITVFNLQSSDAAGNGLAEVYCLGEIVLLWTLLGALLTIVSVRGGFRTSSAVVAVAVFLLAATSQVAALMVLGNRYTNAALELCLQVIMIVSPLLVILQAVAGLYPSLAALKPIRIAPWRTVVPLVLLSLLPWPSAIAMIQRNAIADAEWRAAQKRANEEASQAESSLEQARLAALRAFPADASLSRWIPYTAEKSATVREEARAGIRKLTRRQDEAETMLGQGDERVLREVPYLDLAPTALLCDRARKVLSKQAEHLRPTVSDPPPFSDVLWQIAPYLPAMEWLAEHGCGCQNEIAVLKESIRRYPDSMERAQFLDRLTLLATKVAGA